MGHQGRHKLFSPRYTFRSGGNFFWGERSMLPVPHFVQSRFCLFCGWGAAWNVKVALLLG